MANKSVSLNLPVQFVEVEKINPLITKTTVKIMYAGKNRNGSFISKEVAEKMAGSLPNVPIVGEWISQDQDFGGHGEEMYKEENGNLQVKRTTSPIGVVPSDSKIWWETFLDDDKIERDYMCCEAYIWTDRYPESQKIFEGGTNNQSMELDPGTIKGSWAQLEKNGPEYFIIEEALFTALCVLGENVEPCFEGASINPVYYSLTKSTKDKVATEMALLRAELAQALQEYGEKTHFPNHGDNQAITIRNSQWKTFDPQFAEMIKNEHPDVWKLGGNIKGNSQYRKLSEALGKSEDQLSDTLKDAIKLREAWVARHYQDFRIAGVIAQIKWLAVGSKGEAYMKNLVREEIKKREARKNHSLIELGIDESIIDVIDAIASSKQKNNDLPLNHYSEKEDTDSMSKLIKKQFNEAESAVEDQEVVEATEEEVIVDADGPVEGSDVDGDFEQNEEGVAEETQEESVEESTEEEGEVAEDFEIAPDAEPVVEVEDESAEQEISLKDLVAEIVKEVLAANSAMASDEEEAKEDPEVEKEEDKDAEKYSAFEAEIAELRQQVKAYEMRDKQAMLERFSMLDSAFLEEVKSSLESYTIDALEAKLSIEAVRSGLVFKSQQEEVATYTVDFSKVDAAPSWLSALESK
jgi:hypothetical protein